MNMNRVLAHSGAKYPILQAPMGWIARTPLASAVSRAGGLGIIETSSGETANCQAEILKMLELHLPFGVNLPIRFLKDDAMLKFVCYSGVKFVTTSAGSPIIVSSCYINLYSIATALWFTSSNPTISCCILCL